MSGQGKTHRTNEVDWTQNSNRQYLSQVGGGKNEKNVPQITTTAQKEASLKNERERGTKH
jgi:hypothetical protein